MTEKVAPTSMEIYVRFNDDMEKDYCFQVKQDTQFRDLLAIFKSLPIALRPNIFYDSVPVGFIVSTNPGYLTEDGALLFSYETSNKKYQKHVNFSDKISDHCWPGQLVMPIWDFQYFRYYSFIALLLTWLYTDLPDCISPTPGICMTNQASSFLAWIATKAGYPDIADLVIKDVQTPAGLGAQLAFFFFHIIKTIVIYFVVYFGAFNPRKFRFTRDQASNVTKEKLLDIGWTGSRRANPDEYQEHYREYKIKEHGGMVQAHQAGVFTRLKKLGVWLGDGEGWNTPLSSETKIQDITPEKYVLSYGYFVKLGLLFEKHIEGKSPEELSASIKQFRRYGLLHSDEVVSKLVEERKKNGDVMLN